MQEQSHDLLPSLCRCDSDGTNSQLGACDSPLHLFQLLSMSCTHPTIPPSQKCHVGGTRHVRHRAARERILFASPQYFSTSRLLHHRTEGTPLPTSPRTPQETRRRGLFRYQTSSGNLCRANENIPSSCHLLKDGEEK